MPEGAAAPKLRYEELTEKILGAAIEVHKLLGRGCWNRHTKNVYAMRSTCEVFALSGKLRCRLHTKESTWIADTSSTCWWRDTVILELKCVERITSIHEAQLLTYMKLLNKPVGFIINFNVPVLRAGIVRKVL